jgi:hypothetical protein
VVYLVETVFLVFLAKSRLLESIFNYLVFSPYLTMNLSIRIISTVVLSALSFQSAQALVIRSYSASRHGRFLGFSANPQFNPDFLFSGVNCTGVGWDVANTARQLTMVSPIHFVGANHYKPAIGATIRFLSADGTIKDYTVASTSIITNDDGETSDLFIGTLNTSMPSDAGITFHPYLNLSSEWKYRNLSTMFFGKVARATIGKIKTIENSPAVSGMNVTRTLRMDYDASASGGDDAYMESGDSGSPVFVETNGVAAIVGTNSIVGKYTNDDRSNWCNFVPHYADKLNTVMEAQGYHMTKTTPGTTTITLSSQIITAKLRAGYPVNIAYTLTNTGSNLADNVQLIDTPTQNASPDTSSGSGWFNTPSDNDVKAHKASLASNESSVCNVSLIPTTAGTVQHQVVYTSDQYQSSVLSLSFDVIESFVSWGSGLTDASEGGDDDGEGINNLLEYAFGGDPHVGERTLPGTNISLLPTHEISGENLLFTYVRRKDYIDRAIHYDLLSSSDLSSDSWSDASGLITDTTLSSINDDFEKVTLTLPLPGSRVFFKLNISLDE